MIRPGKDGVLIDLLVQPRAARVRIGPRRGDRLKLAVTAPPVDGKANAAVVAALAAVLDLPRRDLEVISGHSSRRKTVLVRGQSPDRVAAALP
ncbi:MAG: DUF167 family protein [Myxococcota bacterium]